MPVMKSFHRAVARLVTLVIIVFALSACKDPIPEGPLSAEQRVADMIRLTSTYRNNYAFLDYDKKMTREEFEKKARSFRLRARKEMTNSEFFTLMHEWTALFHDAHLGLSLTASLMGGFGPTYENAAHIAYNGLFVRRRGDSLIVTDLIPMIDPATFPIQVGDEITHINGKTVTEYVKTHITRSRDLGHDVANMSLLSNRIFFRSTLQGNFPPADEHTMNVTVTSEDGKTREVELPWVRQDMADFRVEMSRPKEGEADAQRDAHARENYVFKITDVKSKKSFEFVAVDQSGRPVNLFKLEKNTFKASKIRERGDTLLKTFSNQIIAGIRPAARFAKDFGNAPVASAFQMLKQERNVPENATPVPGAHVFPAYIFPRSYETYEGNGETAKLVMKQQFMGYLRIHTFSPERYVMVDGEPQAFDDLQIAEQIANTLNYFQMMGVKNVIIDTMDNPGGSLGLLIAVMTKFKSDPMKNMPLLEFALGYNWEQEFRNTAKFGDPYTKYYAQKILDEILEQRRLGKTVTSAYAFTKIVPQSYFEPNHGLDPSKPLNFIWLWNENNASCGDIAPMIVKDEQLGHSIGYRTMGAGGNVVEYGQLDNSKAWTTMTESRIKSAVDGRYIENRGQDPDEVIDTSLEYGVENKYDAVIEYAIESTIAKEQAECGTALISKGQPPNFDNIIAKLIAKKKLPKMPSDKVKSTGMPKRPGTKMPRSGST